LCSTTPLEDDGISDECFYALADEAMTVDDLNGCLNVESPADVSAACKVSFNKYLECPDMSGMSGMMICGICSATAPDGTGVYQDCFDAVRLLTEDEDLDLEGCEDIESPADVSPACKDSVFEYLECFMESGPLSPEQQQEICASCTTIPLNEKGISENCYNAVGEAGVRSADMEAVCVGMDFPEDVSIACKSAVFAVFECDAGEADLCSTVCVDADAALCFAEGGGCSNFDKDTKKWSGMYDSCNGNDEGSALYCASCFPDCDAISNPLSPEEQEEICASCTTIPFNEKGVSEDCYNAVGGAGVASTDMDAACESDDTGPEDVSIACKTAVFAFFGCDFDNDGDDVVPTSTPISLPTIFPTHFPISLPTSTVPTHFPISLLPTIAGVADPSTLSPTNAPVAEVVPTSKAPVVSPTADATEIGQEESSSNIIVPSILLVLVMTVAGIVAV